jgi:hypothetical protein
MALGSGHDRPGAWVPPTLADRAARLKSAGSVAVPAAAFDLSRTIRAGCFAFDGPLLAVSDGGAV